MTATPSGDDVSRRPCAVRRAAPGGVGYVWVRATQFQLTSAPVAMSSSGLSPLPPSLRCRRFLTAGAVPGSRVLDVGCGEGGLLREYAALGCDVVGIEVDRTLVEAGRRAGLDLRLGTAEALPFRDGEFDRIVCSVVLPYTDEFAAVREWCRVLRPGGEVRATFHGWGYGCHYLLHGDSWKRRVYGARMLVNTVYYRGTSRRLPGFCGDTLCQGPRRLKRYYESGGLTLEEEEIIDRCCGRPRFFAQSARKHASSELRLSSGPGIEDPVKARQGARRQKALELVETGVVTGDVLQENGQPVTAAQ